MKTVVCFGDSNTWGEATVPRPDGRYGPNERWPGVLRAALGEAWNVVEAGLCSRTTVCDDPIEIEVDKNGATALPIVLHSQKPVYALILMLGTNDLKARYARSASDIAAGAGALVRMAKAAQVWRDGAQPRVLVIAPPRVLPQVAEMYVDMFSGAHAKSAALGEAFGRMAAAEGVACLNAADWVETSQFDGIHLGPDAHAALGQAVAQTIGGW